MAQLYEQFKDAVNFAYLVKESESLPKESQSTLEQVPEQLTTTIEESISEAHDVDDVEPESKSEELPEELPEKSPKDTVSTEPFEAPVDKDSSMGEVSVANADASKKPKNAKPKRVDIIDVILSHLSTRELRNRRQVIRQLRLQVSSFCCYFTS